MFDDDYGLLMLDICTILILLLFSDINWMMKGQDDSMEIFLLLDRPGAQPLIKVALMKIKAVAVSCAILS